MMSNKGLGTLKVNKEFEPCVNTCVLCNFWWMQIDSEKLRTQEALRSNLAQPTFYPTHVETEVQRGKVTFLRCGGPNLQTQQGEEGTVRVPHSPLLSATRRLKSGSAWPPSGAWSGRECMATAFVRVLPSPGRFPQLLPQDGSLWTGPTAGSPGATSGLPPA